MEEIDSKEKPDDGAKRLKYKTIQSVVSDICTTILILGLCFCCGWCTIERTRISKESEAKEVEVEVSPHYNELVDEGVESDFSRN